MGNRRAIFIIQIDGIHELAVDVELELIIGAVPNAHRGRLLVAFPVDETLFGEEMPPVNAIHHLQRPVRGEFAAACLNPPHKGGHLVGVAQETQRIERKRRVPDPGIAVIPVALATQAFGEAKGRGRDE